MASSYPYVLRYLAPFVLNALPAFFSLLLAQPQQLSTRSLYVYEDEIAFVFKEGNIRFQQGRAVLGEVPQAINGSYWLHPLGGAEIARSIIAEDTLYAPASALNFFDILKANEGKVAVVTYQIGEEMVDVVGTVEPFIPGGDFAMLRQSNGTTILISREQVRQVAIKGQVQTKYQEKSLGQATFIELTNPVSAATLQLSYFRKGFSWTPSYQMQLLGDTLARFSLRCALQNKAMDIEDAEIYLMLQDAQQADGTLAAPAPTLAAEGPDAQTEAEGKAETKPQLPAYKVGRLSLKKDATAVLPVYNQTLKVRAIHTLAVPNYVPDPAKLEVEGFAIDKEGLTTTPSITFINPLEQPLRPGNSLVLDAAGQPLGQPTVPATPARGPVYLALGDQSTVVARVAEALDDVQEKAGSPLLGDKQNYRRVTIKGKVEVQNPTQKPVNVEVTKALAGQIRRTGGGQVLEEEGGNPLNPKRSIVWEATQVPAGSSQSFYYVYQIYQPN